MTDLSPAAQAVLDAYFTHADLLNREVSHEEMIAAAIRALTDHGENLYDSHEGKVAVVRVEQLLAIATELEGHEK